MGPLLSRACGSSKLNEETTTVLKELFDKLDANHDNNISRDEAMAYWKGKFAKASADQMFGQTDEDRGNTISWDEYMKYWQAVARKYSQDEIVEEVKQMIEGEAWKDWGRVSITNPQVTEGSKA